MRTFTWYRYVTRLGIRYWSTTPPDENEGATFTGIQKESPTEPDDFAPMRGPDGN